MNLLITALKLINLQQLENIDDVLFYFHLLITF